MSLGYPTLRPTPSEAEKLTRPNTNYGVHNAMVHGLQDNRTGDQVHPLEYSEKHWNSNQAQMDFVMLRNSQGIHAPLRLKMERMTAAKMGRLPGLTSSHLMEDTLTGRLDTIDFDDFLNNPMDAEVMGEPHALEEKRLNLLL